MIRVQCGTCKAVLKVPDDKGGKRGRCPVCGGAVAIPRPQTSAEDDLALGAILGAESPSAEEASSPAETPQPTEPRPRGPAVRPATDSASEEIALADETPAERAAPARSPTLAAPPAGGGKRCPSCSIALPYNAKICVRCGIRVPSGRPLLTVRNVDLDNLEEKADGIIRKISWLVPTGIFPIYSEAMGKSRPYATWAITLLTIALSIYAWTDEVFQAKWMLWGGSPYSANQFFEDATPEELASLYHPHQYITHMFLHGDIMHLAGNLVFLLVLGSRVNAKIGNLVMAPVYLLLGVAAAQAHLWSSGSGPVFPMLGASGAIMGLAGMYVVFFPIQKVYMAGWIRWGLAAGFRLSKKVFAVWGILVVLFYISFDVIYTVLAVETGTAHWAHMGGLIAGASLALALLMSRLLYCPGDLLSLLLGRFAWPLLGSPAKRLK